MYLKKGVVYVNFGGTEEVRFLAARGEKVLVSNLKLPGGTKEFDRKVFEREFTEKAAGIAEVRLIEKFEKPQTDLRFKTNGFDTVINITE